MDLLYFAKIRETVGASSERLPRPDTVKTVGDLMDHLRARGPQYAAAFDDPAQIRAAVNQAYVPFDHPVSEDDEVAFFPPMTGG